MVRTQRFIDSYENPIENIDDNPNMQTRYDKNMQILMCIIDAVLICARQGIALRTHGDDLNDPFVRDKNFIAILKGFANIDDTLKNTLKTDKKMQKCVQGKFRMKSLLALQNLCK